VPPETLVHVATSSHEGPSSLGDILSASVFAGGYALCN